MNQLNLDPKIMEAIHLESENMKWQDVSKLKLIGVNDFDGIENLKNLEELVIYGCAILNLEKIFLLNKIVKLTILSTPLKEISGISRLEKLEHLDLIFTYVEDVSFLLNNSNLKYVRLYGNPIYDNQYREIFSYVIDTDYNRNKTIWDISNESDWGFNLRLFKKYDEGCFSTIGRKSILSIPGISVSDQTSISFSSVWTRPMLEDSILLTDRSPVELIRLTYKKLDEGNPLVSTFFPSISSFQMGFSKDAKNWVAVSSLTLDEKIKLNKFIDRFRNQFFYKEDKESLVEYGNGLKIKLPTWYLEFKSIIGLIFPFYNLDLQFGIWDDNSELIVDGNDNWFSYGFIGCEENYATPAIKSGDKLLYTIAQSLNGEEYYSINLASDKDKVIYRYFSEDMLTESIDPKGVHAYYEGYADMLYHIANINIPEIGLIVNGIEL